MIMIIIIAAFAEMSELLQNPVSAAAGMQFSWRGAELAVC